MAYAPYPLTYTPEPTVCAGGPQAGTKILQAWICSSSPWKATFSDLGIFACRDIYGDWCPGCNHAALSSHASGRAGDSGCPVVAGGHPHGHALAAWLVKNHKILGIQEVIWARRRWTNQTQTWRDYDGVSPHLDHVHWSQNSTGARYTTLGRIQSVAPTTTAPNAPVPGRSPVFLVMQKSTGYLWLIESAGGAVSNGRQLGRRTRIPDAEESLAIGSDVPYLGAVSDGTFGLLAKDRTVYS